MSLAGKKAVVTGGSRGLGLGIVEELVSRQTRVVVVARDAGVLESVRTRLGVETISADITDAVSARSILADIRPEILILNAGATPVIKMWAPAGVRCISVNPAHSPVGATSIIQPSGQAPSLSKAQARQGSNAL